MMPEAKCSLYHCGSVALRVRGGLLGLVFFFPTQLEALGSKQGHFLHRILSKAKETCFPPDFLCWPDLALPWHKVCKPSTTEDPSLEQTLRRCWLQTPIPFVSGHKSETNTISAPRDITVCLRLTAHSHRTTLRAGRSQRKADAGQCESEKERSVPPSVRDRKPSWE